jgi:hypothetical protein
MLIVTEIWGAGIRSLKDAKLAQMRKSNLVYASLDNIPVWLRLDNGFFSRLPRSFVSGWFLLLRNLQVWLATPADLLSSVAES